MKKLLLFFVILLIVCVVGGTVVVAVMLRGTLNRRGDLPDVSGSGSVQDTPGDDVLNPEVPKMYIGSEAPESIEGLRAEIDNGMLGQKSVINISAFHIPYTTAGLSMLQTAFADVAYLDADLFYIGAGYKIGVMNGYITQITPTYLYSKNEITLMHADFESRISEIINAAGRRTGLDLLIFYHDYIIRNYNYDYRAYSSVAAEKDSTVYTAYGMMTQGVGVCQAYTMLYAELLERSGIVSHYAGSEEKCHIWNVVFLDGEAYNVDLTWDDRNEKEHNEISYANFLISTAAMTDHGSDRVARYACNSTKYDSAWFHGAKYYFTELDGKYYTVFGNEIVSSDMALTKPATVRQLDNWKVFNSSQYYPDSTFTGLGAYAGKLYFNDYRNIYAYDPKSGTVATAFEYGCSDGYLYGFTLEGNTIDYRVAKDASTADVRIGKLTLTSSLKCDGKVNPDSLIRLRRSLPAA